MKQKKDVSCSQKSTVFVSKSNSKVASYRTSDVLSNMITTNLLKSKKCHCINEKSIEKSKNQKSAYQLAEEEGCSKLEKEKSWGDQKNCHDDKSFKKNMKELLILEARIAGKASRIMNKKEKKFCRKPEQLQSSEKLIHELSIVQKRNQLNSAKKQKQIVKKIMERTSQKNQEQYLQRINFSLCDDFSRSNSMSYDEIKNSRESELERQEKKLSKEVNKKNYDEVLRKERIKLTWRAFHDLERFNTRQNKKFVNIQKQNKENIKKKGSKGKKVELPVRYLTQKEEVLPDYYTPVQRKTALQNYNEKFKSYINNFLICDKMQ